ncbi:hypothetical protein SAMN05421769_2963 [Chryseobacterium scophthalmum]|uniref:Uncharacterized protein n=1 Tax=Chryseobacterium scophthalmum TaxID=59733 RepID=A0A1N6HXN3_9FLAO|nr:hypothetical protein SAMN05421769_2963 [Chryseobacterium scophthalmum]
MIDNLFLKDVFLFGKYFLINELFLLFINKILLLLTH